MLMWVVLAIHVDTGRKLNVHKTFRRRPVRLLNVLCTFNLRPVSMGISQLTRILKSSTACQNSYLFTRISALPNISMSNE